MSVLDGGFDPVHGHTQTRHPENYAPERPQPPISGYLLCVVGDHWTHPFDMAIEFGLDRWGQSHNRGWCREHWDGRPSAAGGMEPADELGPER